MSPLSGLRDRLPGITNGSVQALGKIKSGSIDASSPLGAVTAGDSSLPDPSIPARVLLVILCLIAAALAWVANASGWTNRPFEPARARAADFGLFAGFYIAAAVIERGGELIAPVLPPWTFEGVGGAAATAHTKADRALLMIGVSYVLGVCLSFLTGLYFLAAVGFDVSRSVDVGITGLVISGGTTAIHNILSAAQKQGNPQTPKTTGA